MIPYLNEIDWNGILINEDDLDVLECLSQVVRAPKTGEFYLKMDDKSLQNVLEEKGYLVVTQDGSCFGTDKLRAEIGQLKSVFN